MEGGCGLDRSVLGLWTRSLRTDECARSPRFSFTHMNSRKEGGRRGGGAWKPSRNALALMCRAFALFVCSGREERVGGRCLWSIAAEC